VPSIGSKRNQLSQIAALVTLALAWAAGAARGQVDERPFTADQQQLTVDVTALAAEPTRAPGTQGYYNAARYLRDQIARLPNVSVNEQRFNMMVPVTDSAGLTIPGRPAAAIYPLWPAGVRLNATPAEGITGRLVYCANGDLKDITPATLDGQIAVLETAAGDRWTTAINLGARAVLLLGSPDTDNLQLRSHDLPVPVNFPRFYLPPGPLADDLRHGRVTVPATLRASVTWRRAVAINYFALVKRPDSPAAGPGGEASAALAITVPYDSSCLVPDLAPAASQAVQAASGLALLRDLSRRPLSKPVLFCFTGGDSVAFLGSRNMLMALADPPVTWAAERDQTRAQLDDLRAQLARARTALASPAAIDTYRDRTLVERLAKIIELRELFVQDRLFELRDVRPDQETQGLRADRTDQENRRTLLNRAAYAFRQRPGDLATPDLAPLAADVCRQAIESLAGSTEAPGGLIGDDADRLDELQRRADLYRWLAKALGRNADPQPSDTAATYLLELLVGLDLSDRGYRAGPVTSGRFTRTSTVPDVQHYAEWMTAASNAFAAGDPRAGWFKDVAGTVDLAPLGNALNQNSWMPGTQVIPSEMGPAWGVPSMSFITLDDLRRYRDTPADTLDRLRLRPVVEQLSAVGTLLWRAWDDPRFGATGEHKSRHLTLVGQTVSPSAGRPVPDLPRGGFLVTYFHVLRDDLRVPAVRDDPFTIGARRNEVQPCDADGNYRFEGMWRLSGEPQEVAVNAFQVRPGTGTVTACTDLGTQAGDIQIYANYRDRDPDPLRSLVFNCAEFSLSGLYDPRYLQTLTDLVPLDARRNADPQKYNFLLQRELMAGFVEPGTPLYLLLRYGRVGNRLVLVGMPPVTPAEVAGSRSAESLGKGFTPEQLDHLGPIGLATARDFWRLDDLRLGKYARAGVSSDLLDALHRQAGKQIESATAAAADPAVDARAVVTDADGAWANEARVYAAAQDMANDVIRAAIFLLLLLVPFSFCMERLIVGTPNVYKQIAGVIAIFAVMTGALWSFHPAFQISASPLIIVLAFAIIFMSVVVIGVVYQKFDAELKRIRSGRGTAEGTSVARASVLGSAVVLGIANMRRRRFRTVLTSTTVVLVTFAVLCFTSASRYLDTRTLPTGVPSRYSGLMVRQRGFRPLTDRLTGNLSAAVDQLYRRLGRTDHPLVVQRWWNVNPLDPQDQIHVLRSKTAVVALPAMLGLSPGESKVSDVADVIGPDRFAALDRDPDARVIYLSTATAAELDVREGDIVDVGGLDLKVAGLYDADAFDQRAVALSGEPIAPLKYARDALDAGGKRLADAGADDLSPDAAAGESVGAYDHLPATQFAIVPAKISQLLPHARLATVDVRLADDVDAGDPLVKAVADDVSRRFGVALYAGFKDGVSLVVSSNLSSVSGAGQVAVPLAIAGLIIFNTMMGSIAERRGEIHIYTSLGLAPIHVGALFVAEAMTYGLIGSVFGYVIGQGVGTALSKLGWLGNVTLNYSGTSAMMTMGLVLVVVFLSALVPARLASRIAAPSIERSWRVPPPVDGRITAVLPFTINRTAAEGVLAYLADFFDAHREGSIGKFSAGDVDAAAAGDDRELQTTVWLTPFDLGVRQRLTLRVHPGSFPDVYEVEVGLARLSGDDGSWYRMNRTFLTELRRQFLQWRSLSPQRMVEYIEASRSLFNDADAPAGTAPGLSPASPPALV
jgi:hypothetical protein